MAMTLEQMQGLVPGQPYPGYRADVAPTSGYQNFTLKDLYDTSPIRNTLAWNDSYGGAGGFDALRNAYIGSQGGGATVAGDVSDPNYDWAAVNRNSENSNDSFYQMLGIAPAGRGVQTDDEISRYYDSPGSGGFFNTGANGAQRAIDFYRPGYYNEATGIRINDADAAARSGNADQWFNNFMASYGPMILAGAGAGALASGAGAAAGAAGGDGAFLGSFADLAPGVAGEFGTAGLGGFTGAEGLADGAFLGEAPWAPSGASNLFEGGMVDGGFLGESPWTPSGSSGGLSASDLSNVPTSNPLSSSGNTDEYGNAIDNFGRVPLGAATSPTTAGGYLSNLLGIDPGLLDLISKGGGTLLQMYNANQQSGAIEDLMNQQRADRAPALNAYNNALSNPDSWYQSAPAMGATDAVLRKLSVGGNPAANPGDLAKAAAYNLGGYNNYLSSLQGAAFGGQGTQAQLGLAQINADAGVLGAAGTGLGMLSAKAGTDVEGLLKKYASVQPDGTVKLNFSGVT